MRFFVRWIVLSLAVIVAVQLVPGAEFVGQGYMGAVFCALVLAFLNATLKPILQLLTLPATILTLGLSALILNAVILELASGWSTMLFGSGIAMASIGSAIVASIIISIVGGVLGGLVGASDLGFCPQDRD